MINVISLGAGVQSSTMALMAACGEITPMPDAAIFADTQAEPQSVYSWLDWLETQLPFPVHRVTYGSLADAGLVVRRSKLSGRMYHRTLIPSFIKKYTGGKGMLPRKCTKDHKINMIERTVRQIAQIRHGEKSVQVTQWIGISIDEAHRMKPSDKHYIEHRWPLVDLRISRTDCLAWMETHGYPKPPRSACVFCPYHNDTEWLRLKIDEPQEFQKAVEWERRNQEANTRSEVTEGVPYLHSSLVTIDRIDFAAEIERKRILKIDPQINLFGNECEGMCGV